jgi:alkylhydroperoxidase family enzyme
VTSRVPMLDVDEARRRAEELGIPENMAELSVFRVLLQHPRLARSVSRLLGTLLRGEHLDARLRELLIMRIGWRTGSVYEWTQHWRVARLLDVSAEDLLAVREWQTSDRFGAVERAVLAATDETIDDGVISAATWSACAEHLNVEAQLELVLAIANWRTFSSVLRSLDVPLEAGVEPWPPDGVAPVQG